MQKNHSRPVRNPPEKPKRQYFYAANKLNPMKNPDVARCKIAKGEDEITEAFRAGRGPICTSDGQSFF